MIWLTQFDWCSQCYSWDPLHHWEKSVVFSRLGLRSSHILSRLIALMSISCSTINTAYVLFVFTYSLMSVRACLCAWFLAVSGARSLFGGFIFLYGPWAQEDNLLARLTRSTNPDCRSGFLQLPYHTLVPNPAMWLDTAINELYMFVFITPNAAGAEKYRSFDNLDKAPYFLLYRAKESPPQSQHNCTVTYVW